MGLHWQKTCLIGEKSNLPPSTNDFLFARILFLHGKQSNISRMKYRINHTGIAMRNISHVVNYTKDDTIRWDKVNWIIVSTSHAIYKTKGSYGHGERQKLRHSLWIIAQRRYPVLKRYYIPKEVTGNTPCKVKWYYRFFDLFSFLKM